MLELMVERRMNGGEGGEGREKRPPGLKVLRTASWGATYAPDYQAIIIRVYQVGFSGVEASASSATAATIPLRAHHPLQPSSSGFWIELGWLVWGRLGSTEKWYL